ncbi:4-alpha-glucanotransferase [Aerococcus urinaehominis]|uniref:4-alpha-glucanotransferase n=1 Tax=Aerococcus urinaehominis TaxID=128944 RepID=A0A0X8FL15_9LACT|nr:4-alpha-glucanotransferase [Aerococcus urinaehominis]AMB99272.1 4-alpha-glucanotransferase [Aerococcus urinaehominis]SDM47362.1 4-alpha-glucanotransferase [Aerococcus urinaehominis]
MTRASGVLLHISSLANDFGIGSFGQSAYDFVDFLVATKQSYWQILPLTTTSYGDSPYQSFSAFAGNTHFIDLERLSQAGLLNPAAYRDVDFGSDPNKIDYAKVFEARRPILEQAVANFVNQGLDQSSAYQKFVTASQDWLDPYCRYMTVKEKFGLQAWYEWDEAYQDYQSEAVAHYVASQPDTYKFHEVCQYFFQVQWQELKAYANSHHIQIIGDMPIYVARDSVEMWQRPEYFKVDVKMNPTMVAGVPPDAFTADGQYWGNPIYDWDYMADQGYDWWLWRLDHSFDLYDIIRIDHFRGFESFWEVPFGAPTAAYGHWTKGPGNQLFDSLKAARGDLAIIAEDLGYMTQEVIDMRDATGYPGMRILQFAFDGEADSDDLPHHYPVNSVAYVGTHDNETARGWYEETASQAIRDQMDAYLNRRPGEPASHALNRGIAASVSDTVIYTMQDLLDLGNEARMNVPSTIGINWMWRMDSRAITNTLKEQLLNLTSLYFRENEKLSEDPEDI